MRQKLLREAQRQGVTVIYGSLPPPYWSLYRPAKELIIVNRGLVLAQENVAIGHELGHHHCGHDCTNPHTEAQAWRWAAGFMIDLEDYARAESINPHPAAIALELDVTTKIIIEWQRHHGHRYERTAA